MNISEEDDRPEPFATVFDLSCEYGVEAVLQSLSDFVELNSLDEDMCSGLRHDSLILHQVLESVIPASRGL
jgi:hypothetical protein